MVTDLEMLTWRLYQRVEWQSVPDDVTREDLSQYIADAIRTLYVMTGRSAIFDDKWFKYNGRQVLSFAQDLPLDEQEYVLVTAELMFYTKVQTTVDELTSYTTDAMSVSHGDKPFANLQQKITDQSTTQTRLWYKMSRYHHL